MTFTAHYSARSGQGIGRSSYNVPNITLSGTDRLVVACVNQRATTAPTVTPTFQGLAPTGTLRNAFQGPTASNYVWVYYWLDSNLPANGTGYILQISSTELFDDNATLGSCVVAVGDGFVQEAPTESILYTDVTSVFQTITTAAGEELFDYVCKRHADDEATVGADQTQQVNLEEEVGGSNAAYRVYSSTQAGSAGGLMSWTFSVAGREITHWAASFATVAAAEYTGATTASPGMIAAGEAFNQTAAAEYTGATRANPGMTALGTGEAGLPAAQYTGTTVAAPGMSALGVMSTVVTSRGNNLVYAPLSTGSASIVGEIDITGSGAPQAARATSTGTGSSAAQNSGSGAPQAVSATSSGLGLIEDEFALQGVADAWVETHFEGGLQ